MNIGLLFGSFNPIHVGHLIIANYMLQHAKLDKIWFIVSPQNPFKENEQLLDEKLRLQMVELAIKGNSNFEVSSIEFDLPKPNFTIHTLNIISEKFPEHTFFPIIGGDNLQSFHLWKDYESILKHYEILVYKRLGFDEKNPLIDLKKLKIFEVPFINLSSTYIRNAVKTGESIHYLVPNEVKDFITQNKFYTQ